jgi:hypothetical protein
MTLMISLFHEIDIHYYKKFYVYLLVYFNLFISSLKLVILSSRENNLQILYLLYKKGKSLPSRDVSAVPIVLANNTSFDIFYVTYCHFQLAYNTFIFIFLVYYIIDI